jgi:hypothetical protein
MNHPSFISETGTGTACGTLLVILSSIQLGDILHTAILATIGAAVSFIVTLTCKRLFRRKKK